MKQNNIFFRYFSLVAAQQKLYVAALVALLSSSAYEAEAQVVGEPFIHDRFANLGFCLVSRRRQQGNQSSDIKFLLSSNRAKISEKYIVLFHNFLYRLHYFT